MRHALRPALLALTLLAVAGTLFAQAPPDLSGTWVLQAARSDFGPLPAPERRTDVIDHQEPRLTMTRTTLAQGNETVVHLVYAVDGQPHRNMAGASEVVSRLHWEAQALVMVSTISTPQGDVGITDRLSLSADGQTLTQERTLSAQGQEFVQRLVLTRQ